ncbi:MAG: hypothetical protein F9K30_21190 [Dechloromonas sp.]|nr:MAG: hypothetical protein F9K30_21190 [Dechloromonas sp.]
MSISPTSERTALLWGRCWWLAGRTEPLGFENLSHAAEVLAAHLAGEPHPVRLRLIYQPDSLMTVAVACPHGPRAALQKALAFEHPAIADPARAWSHEPILPLGDGYSTLLHYETEPGLFSLVARLAHSGVIVTSAWPLATFLQSLPKELSETGAILVLAFADGHDCALAYHHPADGRPMVHRWHGEGAVDEAQTWIEEETDRRLDDQALLVSPKEAANPDDPLSLPLHEALASPVVMPRSHPAQLLPAASAVTPQRAAIAASIFLLLAGGWGGAAYARDYLAWTARHDANQQEKSALRAEIEHYRVNAAEIVALRARLAGPGSSPPVGELLDAVCGALPPQLALDRIRVAQGRFSLNGHVAPGATAAWEQWRNRLGGKRWTVEPAAAPRDTGAFTVNGVFTP